MINLKKEVNFDFVNLMGNICHRLFRDKLILTKNYSVS